MAGYGENLTGNLRDLIDRAKSGRYKAPPVKRASIPKEDFRKFFDTVGHRQMKELLGRRVHDGVITRLVAKWRRHLPLKEQQHKLNQKLRGHDASYGVTGNYRMLAKLRWQVAKLWRKWLGRRNRGSKPPSWEQFDGMLRVFPLIPAKIVHSVM